MLRRAQRQHCPSNAPEVLQASEQLTQEDGGPRDKSTAELKASLVDGKALFFFVLLVANSTAGESIAACRQFVCMIASTSLLKISLIFASYCTAQLYFKLSQTGGKYEYNTMSAMVIVEGCKLLMSAGQLLLANKGDVQACVNSFKLVSLRLRLAYLFLACSYAAYNQLFFYVMRLVDPGTFSLFKSLTPAAVASLQFFLFGTNQSQSQMICILIQICGIIPVTASLNKDTGEVNLTYGTHSVLVILAAVFYGAFNSVYNARVIKKEGADCPVAVQNGMLYSLGIVINLMSYWISMLPGDPHFFHGYNNANVILLLFAESTVGITISMVYKYGDAVLKSLSQPLVSSILLFLSKILLGAPLNLVKLSGAGTVILSSMLYLKLPLSKCVIH